MRINVRQDNTIHSIQFLRFAAALLVALFHSHATFAGRVGSEANQTEQYLFGFGAVGVHIFFVISGFIMVLTSAGSTQPYSITSFLKRRLLRIYPIYWVCVAVYAIAHFLISKPYHLSANEVVGALILWPSSASLLIGPAWTLCYEMYFYICFGLAMMLSLTRGLIALALAFGSAIAIGTHMDSNDYNLIVATNPLLIEFLLGAAIGWLAVNGRLPLKWGAALTVFGLMMFVISIVMDYTRWPSVIIWGGASAVLLLGIVSLETTRGTSAWVKSLSKLGNSSYVLYLIHIIIITLAVYATNVLFPLWSPPPALAALFISGLSVIVAEAVHHWIERPMLAQLYRSSRSTQPLSNLTGEYSVPVSKD